MEMFDISVSILVLILYCNFASCGHWEDWVKIYSISLYYFLQHHVTQQLSQMKNLIEK